MGANGQPQDDGPQDSCAEMETPAIVTSELLGPPPYVLRREDVLQLPTPFENQEDRHIRQVDENTLVKFGSCTLAEAEAMRFISTHTSIKTPEVIGAYLLGRCGYMIMSYERGKILPAFWDEATDAEREKVIEQLKRYMSEMRSIKGEYVGGFNRNPCVAGEFMWDHDHEAKHQYGPYRDEEGLNEGIVEAYFRAFPGPPLTDVESQPYNDEYAFNQLVRSLRNHEIVFTHGDLNPSNILVRGDLTVVILDWATAGFYPEYWEWYKATWMGQWRPSFIRQVERYIPPFWIEAKIMRYIFDMILG
ncbi:kinase-like protein [Xylariaceae sp. FL0594]|nr:kinase-like protein [Xylariaceae sp. FL0594]